MTSQGKAHAIAHHLLPQIVYSGCWVFEVDGSSDTPGQEIRVIFGILHRRPACIGVSRTH